MLCLCAQSALRARRRKFRFQEECLQWKWIFFPVWWRRCNETHRSCQW